MKRTLRYTFIYSLLFVCQILYLFVSIGNAQTVKIIPIVVHILHNANDPDFSNDEENISNAQVLTQINVLNEDYRQMCGTPGKSSNSLAADMKLEFRLADTDPSGNPTNGISRKSTTATCFVFDITNDDIKIMHTSQGGEDAWNTSKYLNIWVGRTSECSDNGDGTFPIIIGDPTVSAPSNNEYGVILDFRFFGDNVGMVGSGNIDANQHLLGHSCTHEIAHYLGLYHTFHFRTSIQPAGSNCSFNATNTNCDDIADLADGDNDEYNDQVCDTPPVGHKTTGCSAFLPCTTTQIENYMDYSCDNVRNMFTAGQKARVDHFIANDDILSAVPNSSGFQNTAKDFILFGFHDSSPNRDPNVFAFDYEYNSTSPIVTKSSSPYTPMTIAGNFSSLTGFPANLSMRSKKEVHLQTGFYAESGCIFQAFTDNCLPESPKKSAGGKPTNISNSLIRIEPLFPNPTTGEVNVRFTLSEDAIVNATVFDILGKSVSNLLNEKGCNSGVNNFKYNFSSFNAGTYYCRFSVGNEVLTQKLVINK